MPDTEPLPAPQDTRCPGCSAAYPLLPPDVERLSAAQGCFACIGQPTPEQRSTGVAIWTYYPAVVVPCCHGCGAFTVALTKRFATTPCPRCWGRPPLELAELYAITQPIPPMLLTAIGYADPSDPEAIRPRYVGLWYRGHHPAWATDRHAATSGSWEAYRALLDYLLLSSLAGLGADDAEATHALLIERDDAGDAARAYYGPLPLVETILHHQWPSPDPRDQQGPLIVTMEALQLLPGQRIEQRAISSEARALFEQRATAQHEALAALRAWIAEHPPIQLTLSRTTRSMS